VNKQHFDFPVLLTAKEAGTRLKVSLSWLAKARMRGDGPPYSKIGRSIRYSEAVLIQWMKARQRMSTSDAWVSPPTTGRSEKVSADNL
jgi:hypothetical protein